MNNIDIDTILIALVLLLVIVVILRIAIQRYRLSHAALPDNVREARIESNSAAQNKNLISIMDRLADLDPGYPEKESDKNETENKSETETKSEQSKQNEESEKVESSESKEAEIKEETESNIAKEGSDDEVYELDYELFIKDPASIFKDKSIPVKQRIAAIREAGYQKLESAVPDLIEALYDSDPSISLVAAECLGVIGDSRAIEPLLEISKKNDTELSKVIEEHIGGALVVSEGKPAQEEDNESEEPSPKNYKEMVVFTAEQLPIDYFQSDGSLLPRKELVIKGLNDDNEQFRQMAAKAAIGLEETEDVVEPLTKALSNPLESEAIRAMAAEALGGMNSEKSITALINAIKDENVAVRYASTAALSGRSEPRAVEALIGATRDSDKYVRSSAAYALGASGAAVALKALIKCAEDENEVVRFSAVKAISTYKLDDVLKRLDDKSGKESHRHIFAKIEILSQFKDKRAVEILKNYLENSDSEICYKASMALMGQENPELIEELINASKRLDEELYRLAKENMAPEIFSEITKFNTGFDFNRSTFGSRADSESESASTYDNEVIENVAEAIRNRNDKKQVNVLNINPEDYSDENIAVIGDDSHKKEEVVAGFYESIEPMAMGNEYYDQDSVKDEQNQENEIEPVEIGNAYIIDELVDEEEMTLEEITGLPYEFEKIRKKLLDSSPNTRGSAANALGNYISSSEAITLLRGAIKDENDSVRAAVINSLGKFADMKALKLILTCERDRSTEVRYAVVKAIGEIPDYLAIEALKRMASVDPSIEVKRNARIALEKQGEI